MSSNTALDIVRYDIPESPYILRSHILHPRPGITVICMIRANKENVLSVVEDHLLESISATEWHYDEEDSDFTYVTEKYNHFLSNLAEEDIATVHALFAVERDSRLMVSTLGVMKAVMREYNGHISLIQEDTTAHHHFELISSGDIILGSTIFLSSDDISHDVGEDFYSDIATLDTGDFESNCQEIMKRESLGSYHIVRISRRAREGKNRSSTLSSGTKQSDIVKDRLLEWKDSLARLPLYQKMRAWIQDFLLRKNQGIMAGFLVVGVVIFFGLISYLISALFHASSTGSNDSKNQLLRAKTLVEESQKLSSNPDAFDHSIEEAVVILSDLKKKDLYLKETDALFSRIEAMKKEIYDIQTVDLKSRKSIIAFNPIDISPLGVYEYNKKITLIGKQGAITSYALGEVLPKVLPYPPGEEAVDYTYTDEGLFLALTKNNRVIASRKNTDISYLNVTGQETWEKAETIDVFNGNIYLTDTQEGQIYKHKPGINGYSQKSPVLPVAIPHIQEVHIDGGFYIVSDGGKIWRIMTVKGYTQSGLTLNKIPGEYTIGKGKNPPKIITATNLKYIYVLDNDRVWIFEPDSKRFQDIKTWTYVAQMELSTTQEIRSIHVPRDGLIYVTTNLGVYDVGFELVDKNIILRT